MKFSEMKYERPDVDVVSKEEKEIIRRFSEAETYDDALQAYRDWDKISSHVCTMSSIAYTRHSIDTNDVFYDKEVEYLDEKSPLFTELSNQFSKVLVESKFRPQLEEQFGKLLFINTEMFLKAFSPVIIEEMQQENKLTTQYQKLIASAQIEFDGKKRTLSELTPYKQNADDAVRHAAWLAEGRFYQEHGEELDKIYDDMVTLRTAMAKKLGLKDYVELGYLNMTRNSYNREDVEKFRKAVVKYIVPVADKIYRRQAQRTGLPYPLTFSDASLRFRDGNAKPQGTAEDILAVGKTMYHDLSEQAGTFIDMMYDNELLDVLSKKGKAGGGYCTQFTEYKVPFVFANFNGTQGDVEVITHEAGHAFAYYVARDIEPIDCQSPTMESCEIHSMTMEFFGWKYSDAFFGSDSQKFRQSHLESAITFIPYGTMVDHFQHIMYEQPNLTPSQRHEVWRQLLSEYMPWMLLDDSPFYGEGKGWQRQMHIYECPFYYIDYCFAQTVALEFWTIMQKDRGEAWERYMRLLSKGGTQTFNGLVETAGLSSPFEEETLKSVAQAAEAYLEEFH